MPEGPLTRDARTIAALMRIRRARARSVVTLAEEMPVNEAVELEQKLGALGIAVQHVVCNQIYPEHFPPARPWRGILGALAGEAALGSPLRELAAHRCSRAIAMRSTRATSPSSKSRVKAPVHELPIGVRTDAAADERARSSARSCSRLLGGAHREQRLAVDLEAVDAVLGLDVDHLAAGLAEHALHGRRDHADGRAGRGRSPCRDQ